MNKKVENYYASEKNDNDVLTRSEFINNPYRSFGIDVLNREDLFRGLVENSVYNR